MQLRTSTIDTIPQGDVTVSTYRFAELGPVGIGEVAFTGELRLECDDVGTAFYAHLPIAGRYRSWHRGLDMIGDRRATPLQRPGAPFAGHWTAGYRALCVRMEPAVVEDALTRLGGPSRPAFGPVLNTADGYGRAWAELLFSVSRQLATPANLLAQPLVAAPLADSLVTGFVLATTPERPVAPSRPVSVRAAIDVIESDPRSPLTLSLLATHCGVSPRALQKAFQQHVGMSPMEYVRDVRLRRAHEELRAADPFADSVAAVARRWGFAHLGRFAAAHEARFGQKPLRTLRG
jgi:AraC-like DNA-binding protein